MNILHFSIIMPRSKKNTSKSLVFHALSLMLCISIEPAFARWATPQDGQNEIEYIKRTIYVHKNGTSKTVQKADIVILKEQAKRLWAHYPIGYNSAISQYKVVHAHTTVNGKQYPVTPEYIEDKPIASNHQAFDQLNQITIAYPQLQLNAKIFLETQSIVHQSPLPDYYSNLLVFGQNNYTKLDNTHIVSELPLYIQKNDPDDLIEISQTTEKNKNNILYIIDIKQKKPFIQAIVDESAPIVHAQKIPCVSISSIKNWSEFGKAFAIDYEKIKNEPLPRLYQEIADIAKTQKTPIQKINTVTSLLSEKVTYLSDMKTIQGRLIPQHLQKVADSCLGDCKDFSMATACILESIGIPSKIALVARGEKTLSLPLNLPNPSHFNHAIVKVELATGALWIDPTNFHSMASPVFPDIANRRALVLDINHAHLEMIPSIDPKSNTFRVQEKWDMHNPESLNIKGHLMLTGPFAKDFTGVQKIASTESIKHALITTLNENYGHILEKDIQIPSLISKIVEDLSFQYHIQSRNVGVQTNAGTAMPLMFDQVTRFQTKKDTVSDIYLGIPQIVDILSTIENIHPKGHYPLNCHIQSPWVDFIRQVEYKKNNIIVHQRMELKKSWLTGEELKSKEYKKLQLALDTYFNKGIAIIFEHNIKK